MSNVKRRLATILATDCVGFSKHMTENEELTLENLKACRSIIDPLIEEYGGKIFYTAGDSVIADFSSPVECVNAAIKFQKAIADRNDTRNPDSKLIWRVGVHLDDVIIEGDNIYGNGVNIAARLEAQCAPGQILLSRVVQEQVNERISFTIEAAGTKALKNISDSYEVFGIAASGGSVVHSDNSQSVSSKTKDYKPKIAVLPFSNMNNDEDSGFLVDGVVEDLITEFSRVKELEIVSRQSCFDFKGSGLDVKTFCKNFDVDFSVTGNIRSSGKRVRLSIELSEVESGKAIWSNKFDKVLDDIFDVQDEIVRKISHALLGEIEVSSLQRANRKPTENLTSYEYLLKGKVMHHKVKKEALLESIELFDKAIQADPNNGQAYAWKGCAIGQGLGRGFLEGDMNQHWATCVSSVQKAMEINENDFECHRLFGEVNLSQHDFRAAEMHARKCYEMVPNDPRVLSIYGDVMVRVGSVDDGLEALERALELDPIPQGKTNSDSRTSAVLFGYFMARDSNKCLEIIEKLQDMDSRSWLITAKICDDEEIEYKALSWFQDGLSKFKDIDWKNEIDRFHLNNTGAQKALEDFSETNFKN
ncbi:MAG: adenylate/guanylate cyclase domain-containing protein [Paracoccaceae bacterium]|nr:adenylate/guanylate cyclase domain-containing protein [Paracoccaceae bacterium]